MPEKPVTSATGGVPYRYTVADLVDYICQPAYRSDHLQAMHDFNAEVNVLALTLDGEGRSQSVLGRTAIAWSVKNRQLGLGPLVDKDDSIYTICLRKWQYSTWMKEGGLENYIRQMKLTEQVITGVDNGFTKQQLAKFEESRYIAAGVIKGMLLDPTNGCAHYMTRELYVSPKAPKWISAAVGVHQIERHIFMRGIR